MAEKRFYWLKLKEDYFNSPKIKKLRKIAGGDTYTIIYLKMQLLSVRNGGIIPFENIEPTFEEELALKLDEDLENVKVTLAYLQAQSLLEANEDNQYLLIEASNSIGSEGQSAERKRRFDERKKEIVIEKLPKSNALRQRQFRAKEVCKDIPHVPMVDDYTNNKRYSGNYFIVLKRDKVKCAICGSNDCICVHHIDGFDENKPENNAENKMITLCRTCHARVHSGLKIPEDILNSIDYYYDCNENNEISNGSVTEVKRDSISISNSISNSNIYNTSNEEKGVEKETKSTETQQDIVKSFNFGIEVETQILKWLEYKKEKKQTYKEIGLKTLLKSLKQDVENKGEQYVIDSITSSIANNYSGIFPAKQAKEPKKDKTIDILHELWEEADKKEKEQNE